MIKLISLNVENDKHIDLILPFFKSQHADVIVVQELFERFITLFKTELGMEASFAPLCKKIVNEQTGQTEEWGIAVFSRHPIQKIHKLYYVGDENNLQIFDRPTQDTTRYKALLVAEIEKESELYVISTTHFTASDSVKLSEQQKNDMKGFVEKLDQFPEIILAGDLNSERGESLFDLLALKYKDNIPTTVHSTFDKTLHRHPEWESVVDCLFTTPHYKVTSINLRDGISDHLAIIAEIESSQ